MASVEEKVKTGGVGVGAGAGAGGGMVVGGQTLVAEMKLLKEMQEHSGLFHFSFWKIIFLPFGYILMTCLFDAINFSGVRKNLNSELWHACAGPLVSLPQVGSLVFYFPQGHSEQVNESLVFFLSANLSNLFLLSLTH